MIAHVFYTTLLLRYCIEWYCQGSWAMFPSPGPWPCHCSHSCRTLMFWLHAQLQPDPWLALTQASVTRLAALPVDPGYCNLSRRKGSSQPSPKSQPATARSLWPIPLPEPGNEISFGEHRIQGWEILFSRSLSIWGWLMGVTVSNSLRFLQQCITVLSKSLCSLPRFLPLLLDVWGEVPAEIKHTSAFLSTRGCREKLGTDHCIRYCKLIYSSARRLEEKGPMWDVGNASCKTHYKVGYCWLLRYEIAPKY